ncbi:MAG TPA: hypothetical protein VEF55_07510 [Candidatus Binatia bacterium]|nr:hypothetical protein [Candidatus Binatia bacterium]
MLRRWVRRTLATLLAGFVATGAVAEATAPLFEIIQPASIAADVGGLRIEVNFEE